MTPISLLCLNQSLLDTFDLINHFILTVDSLHSTAKNSIWLEICIVLILYD